jgi:hypothetical protein
MFGLQIGRILNICRCPDIRCPNIRCPNIRCPNIIPRLNINRVLCGVSVRTFIYFMALCILVIHINVSISALVNNIIIQGSKGVIPEGTGNNSTIAAGFSQETQDQLWYTVFDCIIAGIYAIYPMVRFFCKEKIQTNDSCNVIILCCIYYGFDVGIILGQIVRLIFVILSFVKNTYPELYIIKFIVLVNYSIQLPLYCIMIAIKLFDTCIYSYKHFMEHVDND